MHYIISLLSSCYDTRVEVIVLALSPREEVTCKARTISSSAYGDEQMQKIDYLVLPA